MARAGTTLDTFNVVAECCRREILVLLAGAERPVGEMVTALELERLSVSRRLRSLRNVGPVHVRCRGQNLYRTKAEPIRPLHEWMEIFEHYWQHLLNRTKELREEEAREAKQATTL
jgi:DNA-binding transcriptional ArsR family regulator